MAIFALCREVPPDSTASECVMLLIGASRTTKLAKVLPEIEGKETNNTMLLAKCHSLESAVVEMRDVIVSLISDFLTQKSH